MTRRDNKSVLSRRQFECLQGVADLLDSVQIADRLGISEHTVNGHLSAAVSALQASSRRDAVLKYFALQREHPEKVTGQFLRVSGAAELTPSKPPTTVKESTPPEWQGASAPVSEDVTHDVNNRLRIVAFVIVVAAAIAILLLALDPLANSAMRMANRIQPFHHR